MSPPAGWSHVEADAAELAAAFRPGVHPAMDLALDLASQSVVAGPSAVPSGHVIGVLAALDAETAGFLAAVLRKRAAGSDSGMSPPAASAEQALDLAGAVVHCVPDVTYAIGQLRPVSDDGRATMPTPDRVRRALDALDRVAAELARVQPQALAVIEQAAALDDEEAAFAADADEKVYDPPTQAEIDAAREMAAEAKDAPLPTGPLWTPHP